MILIKKKNRGKGRLKKMLVEVVKKKKEKKKRDVN